MRFPFLSREREFAIDRANQDDARALALIHREDFARPWSRGEFEDLLAQPAVFGFVAREIGRTQAGPAGFVLARLAADEGEILTVAVSRSHRRLGLGRGLIEAVLRELHAERAAMLFLEVDETNVAAVALYKRLRFQEVARRPAYYERPEGGKAAALVMRRDLRKFQSPGQVQEPA